MTTIEQLRTHYGGRPCLPLDEVRREWLPRYRSNSGLLRAIAQGRLKLRVTTLENGESRYSSHVVYLRDLLHWLESRDPSNTPAAHQAA